jgi:hypothetical protein
LADLSDVETALAALVMTVAYPQGGNGPSLTGKPMRVYRGWPLTGALDLDLAAGIANVSVFAVPGATRNTTRWGPVVYTTPGVASLTVEVSGTSVSFGGTGGAGLLAGILVDGVVSAYRLQAGDTPALVAAVLAQDIRAGRTCWLSGATLTVPGAIRLIGRTGADGATVTEWGRQEQGFRISAWCPDPATRDVVCSELSAAFAATGFLTLADGTGGRVRYRATSSFDEAQDAQLYRRDLIYDVDYATTVHQGVPSLLFGDLHVAGSDIYG